MIYRLEILFGAIKHFFNRNEWLLRLLGMPKSNIASNEKGLIIIQIDGLSHTQLLRGIDAGNMPLLKYLLEKERYHLHSLYSGLPSSTPAVQGELFYGVKSCVPAFSFRQHEDNDVVMMVEPAAAARVEEKLAAQGEPLLKGGSAYANIFSGGAKEPHFCSVSMGWGSFFRSINPLTIVLFILLNIVSFLRILTLIILEFLLALVDFIRGIISGHNLLKEITFVPTRVAICVFLRELVTIGVKLDATRGLPIIHANFLGYDEQSHRRGPESAFAHWSLNGIDNAIARIWRTAEYSDCRDYELWIYSDHGQEHTLPYSQQFSSDVEDNVLQIFSNIERAETNIETNFASNKIQFSGEQSQRVQLLGGKKVQKFLRREANQTFTHLIDNNINKPITVAMGPIGFIYSPYPLSPLLRQTIATELVARAHIPLVMATNNAIDNKDIDQTKLICVWIPDGKFYLPADKEKLLGVDHPFLAEATTDLINLCQHPDAGDFVISGWCPEHQPYSFRTENGAHAGPGFEETNAFALLPGDTRIPTTNKGYLRPMDLRIAALNLLGR